MDIHNQINIAIIGDMKTSKKLEDRNQVQEQLNEVLEQINVQYQDEIAAKFTITLGDEFQGLMKSGEHVLRILYTIEQAMYPVRIRFGVGIGKITTKINPDMALGADGPAYYHARSAITNVKNQETKKQVPVATIRIEAEDAFMKQIQYINNMLSLLDTIKEDWSDRQRDIIWDMLTHQDSQKAVANRFQIKQPTVQRLLASGKYYIYKETIDIIENTLKEIGQHV